ncbi:hypothetical protein [Streptomyces mirabilis]|uniref:hypothetical protein n=1 Tax=Streptomyces mirabilis TaxID=68239 RepID=UPI0033D908A9
MTERVVALSELVDEGLLEVGAGRPRSVDLDRFPLPILRVADVLDGKIETPLGGYTRQPWQQEMGPKASKPGDVVLTVKGTVGRVAIMPSDSHCFAYSPQLCYFRPSAGGPLKSRYLYYWFKSADFWRQADALKGQTDMADFLSLGDVCSLKLSLPSRAQQGGVVAVLGALDDKIAVNERIAETAMELAKARYSRVPATAQTTIREIAAVFDGPHATPVKTQHGPWFLSISSLRNGMLDLGESAHLSEGDFPRWTKRVQPQAGDVLFSYETRLGEAAVMPSGVRATLGRRMALLRAKDKHVSGTLLLHAFLDSEFQAEIQRRTVYGATVDRIPLKEVPAWPISLPAEENRAELTAALDALHARMEQTVVENRALVELRDTLLPQLVTGKVRVKDAVRVVEDAV